MRQFFKEGDLISAEVMQVNTQDGKISLQTRSTKYGCLSNGFLLKVDSNYVRRMKNHFVELEGPVGSAAKIQLIIGTNGYIWISCKQSGKEEREAMAVLRNAIVCLQAAQLPIFRETIEQVVAKYQELKGQFDANE